MSLNSTKIEWVKNPDGTQGYTWNPLTGCLNHTNGLCKGGGFPCYAYRLAHGRLKQRYQANENIAGDQQQFKENVLRNLKDPFYPRFWEDRLFEPYPPLPKDEYRHFSNYLTPKGIFTCDMSDLFGIGIPRTWTEGVLDVIKKCPQHRFYLLTKQPQNLIKFSPFPDNCWVGQTITSCLDGLNYMRDIEAKVKFISFEPLLYYNVDPTTASTYLTEAGINWVIIGAQTKPYRPPQISWVEEIVRACDTAGIPVFLKDNLKPLFLNHAQDKDAYWAECILDKGGRIRQELPT